MVEIRFALMVGIRFAFVYSVRDLNLPIAKACREYGISRTTGYSWLKRYDIGPERLMTDYSRRPQHPHGDTSYRNATDTGVKG